MKKIIALVVAIVMMAAMAVPAFADDVVHNIGADGALSGETNVTFGVTQSYTVTIPSDVTIGYPSLNGTVTVSASDVKIAGGTKLYIAVASQNATTDSTPDTWNLKDTGNAANEPVRYYAQDAAYDEDTDTWSGSGEAYVNGEEFLVVEAGSLGDNVGNAGSATIYLYTLGTGKVGTYTDKLTFSATIKA